MQKYVKYVYDYSRLLVNSRKNQIADYRQLVDWISLIDESFKESLL